MTDTEQVIERLQEALVTQKDGKVLVDVADLQHLLDQVDAKEDED